MRDLRPREILDLFRTFMAGGRFLKATPHLSREDMRGWQWERISALVRHAFENVPFYRDLYSQAGFQPGDLKTWVDFHSLPTVSKDQVIANYPARILASGYDPSDLIVSRSSGSSGKPLDIAYDGKAMTTYMLAGLRLYRMGFDYKPWHRQLYVYTSPYPLNSIFGLYPLTFVSTLAPIPDIIKAMRETRPHLLVCYPSHLEEIARHLESADLAGLPLRAISVNSEMSTQAQRDALSRVFGCPVLDEYSSEELTRIAAQCRHGTYHVFEDINYIEVQPDPSRTDGAGLLVGTNLHNYAMPMIRYQQNDIAAIDDNVPVCACGWKFRAMTRLEGRRNDCFIMPSGQTISSGFLLDATYDFLLRYRSEIRDFCLIQEAANRVVLEIVPGPGWSSVASDSIASRLREFFEPSVEVSVREVTECMKTKSGKRNPIISRVSHT